MFSLLESKEDVFKARRKLNATIRRDLNKNAIKDIGYSGGRIRNARVHTDGRFWFWSQDLRAGEANAI